MTNYTPEQLLAMPDHERDALAAEACMGWEKVNVSLDGTYWQKDGANVISKRDWHPSQPTEKGKAQCWDLMMRYQIEVLHNDYREIELYNSKTGHALVAGSSQAVFVTAAILAAQAEQEK